MSAERKRAKNRDAAKRATSGVIFPRDFVASFPTAPEDRPRRAAVRVELSDAQLDRLCAAIRDGLLVALELRQDGGEAVVGESGLASEPLDSVLQCDDAVDERSRENSNRLREFINRVLGIELGNPAQSTNFDQGVEDESAGDHGLGDLVADRVNRIADLVGGCHCSSPSFDARLGAGDTASVGVEAPSGSVSPYAGPDGSPLSAEEIFADVRYIFDAMQIGFGGPSWVLSGQLVMWLAGGQR